jgi:sulfofructose kinase
MARVAALGYACLDDRFWVTEFPPVRARTRVTAHRADLGGSAAVGAVAVARLGGDALFLGRRGDDAAGEQVEVWLRAEHIDTSGFRMFPGARTPVSGVLITPDGERYIFPYAGEGLPDDAGWLPLEVLETVEAVLIDATWPAGAMPVAEAARQRDLPVVLDLDQDTPAVWQLAALATHAIADEPLSDACGGVDATLSRLAGLGSWGAVTLGASGVAYPGGRLPVFPVAARDTTGAGDVFHGAFTLALAEGQDEAFALTFAAAAAAQRCALAEVPRRRNVIRFLEHR